MNKLARSTIVATTAGVGISGLLLEFGGDHDHRTGDLLDDGR